MSMQSPSQMTLSEMAKLAVGWAKLKKENPSTNEKNVNFIDKGR